MIEQDNEPHYMGAVMGRYVLGNNARIPGVNIFACRARYISPTTFIAAAPVVGTIGETVRASFAPFGALRGTISRHVSDGFAVKIDASDTKRIELARHIDSLRGHTWNGPSNKRSERRFMPAEPRSILTLDNGDVIPCLIVDFSAIGASVSADLQPSVGTSLTIGEVACKVVRLFDVGFAVLFDSPQNEDAEEMLKAPQKWRDSLNLVRSTQIDIFDPADIPDMDGVYPDF